jgi:hypothetical protein
MHIPAPIPFHNVGAKQFIVRFPKNENLRRNRAITENPEVFTSVNDRIQKTMGFRPEAELVLSLKEL